MTYGNHRTPDKAHDCSVKLAKQRANGEAGIYMAIPDPDADIGFRFEALHPDWKPPHTPDADVSDLTALS